MIGDCENVSTAAGHYAAHKPAPIGGFECPAGEAFRCAQMVLPAQPAAAVIANNRSPLAGVFRYETNQDLLFAIAVDIRDEDFILHLRIVFRVEPGKFLLPAKTAVDG